MAGILLLEPDAILGITYQQALLSAGHSVQWKRTAQEALHELNNRNIDIVITELQLALHNGVEFLYEFRSYHEWQAIPVIILSQISPERTTIGRALWEHIRIADYYYKPRTSLRDLIAAVETTLAPSI